MGKKKQSIQYPGTEKSTLELNKRETDPHLHIIWIIWSPTKTLISHRNHELKKTWQSWQTYNDYFVTILIWQQWLVSLLISRLWHCAGMLSGRASASGQVALFLLVQFSDLTTRIVGYNGLELREEQQITSRCHGHERGKEFQKRLVSGSLWVSLGATDELKLVFKSSEKKRKLNNNQ